MNGDRKTACVTGASGYIASYLVKLLLQHGYTVKASITNINDPRKTQHVVSLDGAKERLHLFEANLLHDGCECVFHTASPVNLSPSNPQVELIDPAVKGTLNVLRSCVKVKSVKRVVLTSSITTILFNGSKPLTPNVIVDETWFSDPLFCEKSKLWYVLSKTLAEEAAWEFAKENKIDLVTINPGFVIGPFLRPDHLNITTATILNLVNAKTYGNTVYRFVDIRDVALAHIKAFEVGSACGRYCLVESVVHISEALNILSQIYPTLTFPRKCEDNDKAPMETYQVSKERAISSLGIEFTPLNLSLKDTFEALKEKGFIKFELCEKFTSNNLCTNLKTKCVVKGYVCVFKATPNFNLRKHVMKKNQSSAKVVMTKT